MEENWKEKYQEFQVMQAQMEKLSENMQFLQDQQIEIEISKNAINELEKVEIGNEILAPIAQGIFLKAKLDDNTKLLVNVGSGATVEKSIEQVNSLLQEQQDHIQQKIVQTDKILYELNNKLVQLYNEVEGNVRKVKE